MMTRLAQQSVEKIDRTRGHAAKIFTTILFDENASKAVPRYREILKIFLPILNHTTKGTSMDFESLMIVDNEKLKKMNQAVSKQDSENISLAIDKPDIERRYRGDISSKIFNNKSKRAKF